MAERIVRLSLTEAEQARLAVQGVVADERGVLHARSGREVDPGVAAAMLTKGTPDPGSFHRGYLTPGHAANSPGVTGHYATTVMPATRPAEPQDFTRGYLRSSHQKPSPASDLGGNNPAAPDSSAGTVYDGASRAYDANRAQVAHNHIANTGDLCGNQPVTPRWSPSPDMGAANVPHAISVAATKPAPGERP